MKNAALYKIDTTSEQEIYLAQVGNRLSIGTSPKADLQLKDWRCGGIHALIKKDENSDKLNIIDLGSYYGTFVNRNKVEILTLTDGDVVSIGDQKIVLRYSEDLPPIELSNVAKIDSTIKKTKPQALESKKTILETSLYWGGQLLEVKSLKSGTKITVGDPKKATFGMVLEEFKKTKSTKHQLYKLGEYNKGELSLKIPQECSGIVWMGNKSYALDTLRFYEKSMAGSEYLKISLRVGDRAHLEFGELSLFFNFIQPAEKIKKDFFFQKTDKTLLKIIAGIILFYLLCFAILSLVEPEVKEKTIEDIPENLKKIVYDVGIQNADRQRNAAIGEIAKALEGGRARAEEGKSKSNQAKEEQVLSQEVSKKKTVTKDTPMKDQAKLTSFVTNNNVKNDVQPIDFNNTFAVATESNLVKKASVLGKNNVVGNTASALDGGDFARGRQGLGAGGGGKGIGIGALDGNLTGGGMGGGDYGLKPSKGRQISIADNEEVVTLGGLDPDLIASIIKRYIPQIQNCYEQGLVARPSIKGKVTVNFVINAQGAVTIPNIVETTLNDSLTEKCMISKIKTWNFPQPKGGGTVGVKYPFILMSNSGN